MERDREISIREWLFTSNVLKMSQIIYFEYTFVAGVFL